jgi:hypothetical protein
MENKIASKELALRVRDIFRKNSGAPEEAVEEFLRNELQDIPRRQQLTAISKMRDQFFLPAASGEDAHCFDRESYAKLLSLFLGRRSEEVDHFSEETFEKLGASLNTVFDSLNEIISGINATFLGKSTETEETIRLVISANLDSRDEFKPLEQYLNQIKEAFAISHDAFQKAARIKMKEMLDDLSPANIAAQIDKSMKIGPFHKAEMYDIYCEKFKTIEKWLHSGIFTEALLREFEKQCQKSYLKKGGE